MDNLITPEGAKLLLGLVRKQVNKLSQIKKTIE